MAYSDELWELYKLAGRQRPMNSAQITDMDLAYSSLSQVVSKLKELGVTSYLDLEKLKVSNKDTERIEDET